METQAPETVVSQETETADSLPAATTETPPVTTPEGAAGPEKEATQEGEKLPAPDETPPSWATIDGKTYGDAYDALEHEGFRPVLERRDKDIREDGLREGRSQAEQTFNKEQAAEVVQGVAGHLGTVVERLEEGNVEGSSRVVDKIRDLIQPYGKTFISDLAGQAHKQGGQDTGSLMLDSMKDGLPLRAQHELEDFAKSGHKDWRPILKKWLDLQRPSLEAEIEKMRTSRESKEERAARLAQTKPPVKPEGSGGGGSSGYRTKAEARALHVKNEISNAEMKRVNADPSIPES